MDTFNKTAPDSLLIYGCLIVIFLLYLFFTWWLFGKNHDISKSKGDQRDIDGWSPVEWGYLLARGDYERTLKALFLNLAAKGALRIRSKHVFEFERQPHDNAGLKDYERDFMADLFSHNERVSIGKMYSEKFKVITDKVVNQIGAQIDLESYYKSNTLLKALLVPISLAVIISATAFLEAGSNLPLLIMLSLFAYVPFLIASMFYSNHPVASVLILGGILLFLLLIAESTGMLDALLAVVLLGVVSFFYVVNMTRLTLKGQRFTKCMSIKKQQLLSRPLPESANPWQVSKAMQLAYFFNVLVDWKTINHSLALAETVDVGIDNPMHFQARFVSLIRNARTKPENVLSGSVSD